MANSVSKPDKYLDEKQKWYPIDTFDNCSKTVYKCPKGYRGHLSTILNQTNTKYVYNEKTKEMELFLRVDYYIHHSHFIADIDKGRHVRCKIGSDYISVNDPDIKTMYRLGDRDPPQWVRDELDS